MYQFQESLPKQPLPQLEHTCSHYLDAVSPLLSETELACTKAAVKKFQQEEGQKLQKQLETIASSTSTSYIDEFLDERFLEARLPLVRKTNIAQVLSSFIGSEELSPTPVAAILIFNLLKFYLKIKTRSLEPDRDIFQIGRPALCMVQYDNLFGTSRIPGIKRDSLVRTQNSEHIIVIRRDRFYCLNLIKGEQLPTIEQIEQQLNWIIENTPDYDCAVGTLTTLPRTQWAVLRSYITSISPANARSLALLDSALFVVCLDETTPSNLKTSLENAFYGDGQNRWFDKPVQIIVTANCQAAINIEHSGFDGYTVMRMTDEISQKPHQEAPTLTAFEKWESPIQLEWKLSPGIREEIELAKKNIANLKTQHHLQVLEFQEFGADFLRQHTLNVDAIVQLSIQLAYARLYGKIMCVTESVHTRNFQYGRFEDIRTVTSESVELIRVFSQASAKEARYSALNAAIVAHMRRLFNCKKGLNVDLHLLALYSLGRYQDMVPEMFLDKAYSQVFTQPVIWTSSLPGNMGIAGFVFVSPPVNYGYGVSYIINPEKITLCVTSQFSQPSEYTKLLNQSLSELGDLLKTFK
ncbi:choline/carnitine O-acyltransferase [Planktothrix sp. FACHB-1355]|uniref:Choline/carnitine O-acyltransferase n=1 Tax=Aerosakkonema funiforme FACHB-1375 TaxID=2949571 RepID=A0A926VE47_9CYAN|nr:choline/carnitine O-acyltransferase [Aerosakkonema funiforme]MBD2182053.1 choline/carnitine O-acyltransferase [Aerosakkonema funiforme FACHB-1375]MBD3562879.1 choline/carnitine O-acyltransferase [Planktothrix sp. FACHB-1355]